MNTLHRWLCRSASWRNTVETRLPWVVSGVELGDDVLELGPGPGLTTDLLRRSVPRVTALEIDEELGAALAARLRESNVRVVAGDATAMPFGDGQYSAVVCFTMLHHIPSPELQDRLFHEAFRVLRPGGNFVGCDSLQSLAMRVIHWRDTLVPVDPDTIALRLERAGFEVVSTDRNAQSFRFHARRPVGGSEIEEGASAIVQSGRMR